LKLFVRVGNGEIISKIYLSL
jgi:hypothetical protein